MVNDNFDSLLSSIPLSDIGALRDEINRLFQLGMPFFSIGMRLLTAIEYNLAYRNNSGNDH